jgi:hypothetical protein
VFCYLAKKNLEGDLCYNLQDDIIPYGAVAGGINDILNSRFE